MGTTKKKEIRFPPISIWFQFFFFYTLIFFYFSILSLSFFLLSVSILPKASILQWWFSRIIIMLQKERWLSFSDPCIPLNVSLLILETDWSIFMFFSGFLRLFPIGFLMLFFFFRLLSNFLSFLWFQHSLERLPAQCSYLKYTEVSSSFFFCFFQTFSHRLSHAFFFFGFPQNFWVSSDSCIHLREGFHK